MPFTFGAAVIQDHSTIVKAIGKSGKNIVQCYQVHKIRPRMSLIEELNDTKDIYIYTMHLGMKSLNSTGRTNTTLPKDISTSSILMMVMESTV